MGRYLENRIEKLEEGFRKIESKIKGKSQEEEYCHKKVGEYK